MFDCFELWMAEAAVAAPRLFVGPDTDDDDEVEEVAIEIDDEDDADEDPLPTLMFSILPSGDVHVATFWPEPADDDEATAIGAGMTGLICLLNEGRLAGPIKNALASSESHPCVSDVALRLLRDQARNNGIIDVEQPVISPEEAFGERK